MPVIARVVAASNLSLNLKINAPMHNIMLGPREKLRIINALISLEVNISPF